MTRAAPEGVTSHTDDNARMHWFSVGEFVAEGRSDAQLVGSNVADVLATVD